LRVRKPNANEVRRAREILADHKEQKVLVGEPAIYARDTVLLAEYPDTVKLNLQAHRVGDVGIATIPCEVFTAIGLEIKSKRLREQTCALRQRRLDADEVALALTQFGPVWDSLLPREQARLVQLLIEKVEFDGVKGRVAITFYPAGIKTLADELMAQQHMQMKEKRA
jgi:hypothetical protein